MSDWIEWTGGENPVPGKMVDVRTVWCRDIGRISHPTPALSDVLSWDRGHRQRDFDIIAYRLASPPADQPADHIGEGKTFEQIKALIEADEAGRLSQSDLLSLLSLIARQQETIRADGEFAAAYDALRSTWSFRQACALHADDEKYRWACEKFDAAFDAADQARARLSAHQPKEPK